MDQIKEEIAQFKNYLVEDEAIGVVEIILILVVLIALVLLFKNQITKVVNSAFESFNADSTEIIE